MKNNHRRINYVDFLIAIVAILIVSTLVTVVFKDSSKVDFTAKETITVTLKVRNIPIKHSNLINNGDQVFFSDNEDFFGRVKFANYDDETVEFLDKLTNTSTIYKSPDKKTALVLVEAQAEFVDGQYFIADKQIKKSDIIEVFVPSFSFEATIVNIENNKE